MKRIVIAGYGVAGLTAGDTLREAGFDGEITIVGQEPTAPYSRPALSKALLADSGSDPDLSALSLPEPIHGARELLGRTATELDPHERTVRLDDGADLPYDALLIASGSRPRRFTDSPAELTLRSLADALELRRRLSCRPRTLVLGGGALGMEVASGARGLGCEVTVAHRGVPMSRQVGPVLGGVCAREAEAAGVTLLDDVAVAVRTDGQATEVELASGARLHPELLVTAIGDAPNVEWLESSGLLEEGRLVVDHRGLVTPEIAAAGDVAWTRSGQWMSRRPLWMHAIEQARATAMGLLHGDAAISHVPRPYFWTEQFGLHLRLAGPPAQGQPEIVEGALDSTRMLLRWPAADRVEGGGTAAAVNHRLPIPRLRRLANPPAAA